MYIRTICPDDEVAIRRMSKELHKERLDEERPIGHFLSHPTLVAVHSVDERIIGHTSWSFHTEGGGFITWDETIVLEEFRGLGIGRRLMEARAELTPGRVFGSCKESNEPMAHLLTSMGFHMCQRIPNGYGDEDAMLYAKGHENT